LPAHCDTMTTKWSLYLIASIYHNAACGGDLQGLLAQRHVLLAYLTMIYIVWYNHHNLFQKAERITKRPFLLNGLWLFFLTLVPFTTGWVGTAPDAAVPELLYPLNLLAWSSAFHLLDRQILRDNAGAVRAPPAPWTGCSCTGVPRLHGSGVAPGQPVPHRRHRRRAGGAHLHRKFTAKEG